MDIKTDLWLCLFAYNFARSILTERLWIAPPGEALRMPQPAVLVCSQCSGGMQVSSSPSFYLQEE